MPWKGYNFEDAIVISERLFVKMYLRQYILSNFLMFGTQNEVWRN
jgi:DNA-directed RNA polymerase beta subunit